MGIVSYRLNKGKRIVNPKQEVPIYFRYTNGRDTDYNASLRIKVLPSDWDFKKQRIKNTSRLPKKLKINNLLSKIKTEFDSEEIEAKKNKYELDYERAKELFLSSANPKNEVPTDLFSFLDQIIHNASIEPYYQSGVPIKESTLRTWKQTKHKLSEYSQSHELSLKNFGSMEFYNNFIKYLQRQGLKQNTIGKEIKNVKNFCRKAFEAGLISTQDFMKKEFRVYKEPVDSVYLNEEELKSISDLNLPQGSTIKKARDLFIIGCYTGLRVSDFARIDREDIIERDNRLLLKVRMKKMDKDVFVPVNSIVRGILEEYDFALPHIHKNTVGKKIKKIAEMAEINDDETIRTKKNGILIKETSPKFKLIQSHTARRSFCTNAYNAKVPVQEIMNITGHTTEKNFYNYIKVGAEERALKTSDHEFFR